MPDTYGPNHAQVQAYLDRLPTLIDGQWDAAVACDAASVAALDAALDAASDAARDAAREAWRDAARLAALFTARGAEWAAADAADALVVRDLIRPEDFAILTAPMRAAGIDFDALTEQGGDRG